MKKLKGGNSHCLWCVRWNVSSPVPISRHDVEALWLKGKVTGMFNLTTREQFEACQDFCVELGPGSGTRDTAVELRAQVAKLSEENLVLSEALEKERKSVREEKRQLQKFRSFEAREQALNTKLRELTEKVADLELVIQELKEDLKSERTTVHELVSEKTALEKKLESERALRRKIDGVGGRTWLIPNYFALRRSLVGNDDDDDNNNNGESLYGNNEYMYEAQALDTQRFPSAQASGHMLPFFSLQSSLKQLDDNQDPGGGNDTSTQNKNDTNAPQFSSLFSSDDFM